MQSYLYDKSLNIYFGYKGRNADVPTLSPSNLDISVLGKKYSLWDPLKPPFKKETNLDSQDLTQSSPEPCFSKSDPPHVIKQQKKEEKAQEEEKEEIEEKEEEEGDQKKKGSNESKKKEKSSSGKSKNSANNKKDFGNP